MQKHILLLVTLFVCITSGSDGQTVQSTARLFCDAEAVAGDYSGFCQDTDGFLWIGTDRGLFRFDGNSYDIYRHDDSSPGSLSDSRILGLLCDSKGRVWVATANGLNLYEPLTDTFRVIPLPSIDFYGYIIGLAEQNDGTVTFIVSGVGLYIVSDERGEPVAVRYLSDTPFEKELNSIVCTESGRIYLGSHNGTVYSVSRNGNIITIHVSDNSYIQGLALEEDDNVLVCMLNDVYRIDTSTDGLTRLASDNLIHISRLSNSANGKVYVATSGDGLWEVATHSMRVSPSTDIYSPFVHLRTAKVGAVYAAPDGNLWMGCNYHGFVMVPGQPLPFLYRKLADTFPDFGGGLSALAVWDGNLLVGLDKGRLALFSSDGKLKIHTSVPTGGAITSIEVASGAKAFIGVANEGVWELDIPSGMMKKLVDIPGKYPSVVVCEGRKDELFMGVHGEGLLRYDRRTGERTWLPYDPDGSRLTNPYITALQSAPDGKLWIGLYGGIACYDLKADSLVRISQEPFLKGATFSLAPVGDSTLFVGTSHGLIHFDSRKGVLGKYTTADGLTDNDVRCIVVDNKGGKWIGTMRGLSYLAPDNSTILSFHGGYGLVETAFTHARYSASDCRVYLGSSLGTTSFLFDAVPSPGFDHTIRVSALFLNGKRIVPLAKCDDVNLIEGPATSPDVLNLPYKDNALTLRLSTMDFRDASNVCYMWRVGDGDWLQSPPGENLIYLPHMEPGDYNLEIRAVENNVTSALTRIGIHISTPWYLSGFARLMYLLFFLMLLILGGLVLKKKREEKLNDAKIKFFIDVSHDIRSPMTLILSPLESLLKQSFDSDVRAKLQTMYRNAHRILSLVNQLLDIRMLDKGKMRLSCRLTDMNGFVSELVDMFRSQATEKNQKLLFESAENLPEVWLDRDKFDKILVNLIANAIKYTPSGGSIEVKVATVEDEKLGACVRLSVVDTGIGLDRKTEARIFERFYRVRENHAQATAGFGIGLDLCRRLVELHHGFIMGHNRTDGIRGSEFSVTLPLDTSCYGAEELVAGEVPTGLVSGKHLVMSAGVPVALESQKRGRTSAFGWRILVVDDDDELRSYLCSQLGDSYKIKGVSGGAEALKVVGEWQPDIIVSDVMMPGMDGLTLLKRLKANVDTHHIPVVLLSSKMALADRMAGWEKGADGYLGKPFSIDELEALIDTLVENRLRVKGKFSGAQDTMGKIEAPEMKGNDEILLNRIMNVINRNIDDSQLNVEKLSQEVGLSRAHLHRKMKELIGMTPSDYIRNIRLRRACELLRRPDIEVTQVAYKLGFTSQPHFSSHFKRFTGYSPSEYRGKCMAGAEPELPSVLPVVKE